MSNESNIAPDAVSGLEQTIIELNTLEKENARLRIELTYSECRADHFHRILKIYEKPSRGIKKFLGMGNGGSYG